MNDQARAALDEIIATYGPGVCRTPRSCELFLNQALADFPAECGALVQALRGGAVADLLAAEPGAPWPELAESLAARLATEGRPGDAEARWAVESWGRALGRHPETARPQHVPTVRAVRVASQGELVAATTLIV